MTISANGDSKRNSAIGPLETSTEVEANGQLKKTPEEPDIKNEEKKKEQTIPDVKYSQLFRFASKTDIVLIVLAYVASIIAGIVLPFNTIVFARLTENMVQYGIHLSQGDPKAGDLFWDAITEFANYNSLLGTILLITSYLATVLSNYAATKQVLRIRRIYMRCVLNQDISWYDLNESGDFASKMSEDLSKFEDGISDKVAQFISYQTGFFACIIMALIRGWKLALVCLVSFPLTMVSVGTVGLMAARLAKKEAVAYGHAASVAEEVLSSIRTVIAFGGQTKEIDRFKENLVDAKNINIKRGFFSGLAMGFLWFCIYSTYALSFWYGVQLYLDENEPYTIETMMAVFFGIMMGSMQFGISSPIIETFAVAKGSAAKIFAIIDNVPKINPLLDRGIKPAQIQGNLLLKNVHFEYPSRSDVKILKGVDLTISRGQTVALVGPSGCGKSTIVQLLQRFYDPSEGNIYLDDNDLKDISVTWLRSQIGVVGQEPVLFNISIADNIRYGKPDTNQEDIEAAAKKANAHQFIRKLPNGYNTLVGDRGTQLSGGQKQRIAIARALIRNPTILLLDEATSALDNTSEAKVQAALDKAREGRTTIIVAHRLSTIRTADVIFSFENGQVVERGTHAELMELEGLYYRLVTSQTSHDPDDIATTKPPVKRAMSVISAQSYSSDTDKSLKGDGEDEGDEKEQSAPRVGILTILALNKPEWFLVLVSCVCSVIMGAAMPFFSVIFGDIIGVLSDNTKDIQKEINFYCLMFVVIGVISGGSNFLQIYIFGIAGERMTMRLRISAFEAMLGQEMGWYDDKSNSVGALCARLSGDASAVQGATGQRIGTILQSIATLSLGVALAMYYEWRVGLFTLVFMPPMLVALYLQRRVAEADSYGGAKAMEKSTKLAVEFVTNIRTVASLGCEPMFVSLYVKELQPIIRLANRNSHFRGLVFGIARSIMMFAFAGCIYYGGTLVIKNETTFADVMKVSQALVMSTATVANAFAFAPNIQKGVYAAERLLQLLARTPKILDPTHPSKTEYNSEGRVTYSDVHFAYPSRLSVNVLKGLSLEVDKGKTVALVGASGCGKSTLVQLLERFYDPTSGQIVLDNEIITEIPLKVLRGNLGIVQQEPILFDKTIRENIAYGDNSRQPEMSEIIEVAKQANIHTFISSLPQGYDTRLGSKGAQLSGGQKQRVAIARALLRDPKVLLLDEATSALDVESEKVVQEALDKAKEGRTCIVIAHRLSTIQDADMICVIHGGIIAESGKHQELMQKKGKYYRLQTQQSHI